MSYVLLCFVVFSAAYLLNIFYISVLYHRGLTHGAVKLRPWARTVAVWTGNWVTGIDPKGWSCMHRMHHLHSDTPEDPHSPVHQGVIPIMLGQLHSYNRTLVGVIREEEPYASVVRDLAFPVSWLNRHKMWWVPYLFHAAVAAFVGFHFGAWALAACYWLGIMSHPIQGWMVNALGHRFGYRNFSTDDNSRNNLLVSWLVFGEGFQNNHHHAPAAAKFSVKWWEVDLGYTLCHVGKWLGMLDLPAV
jgi:stearoyl-CoA desaturase (delta-9 desaturase)